MAISSKNITGKNLSIAGNFVQIEKKLPATKMHYNEAEDLFSQPENFMFSV
jgi:hypothetical protein